MPNADKAVIERRKLTDYLLSPTHHRGRYKANFFRELGYSAENWHTLERDLRKLILAYGVTRSRGSLWGQKFSVEGPVEGPNGKTARVVTVWIILTGEHIPRLVTAYRGSRLSQTVP